MWEHQRRYGKSQLDKRRQSGESESIYLEVKPHVYTPEMLVIFPHCTGTLRATAACNVR